MDKQWRESAHFRANVGCADCHGENHETVFAVRGQVSAGMCGKCHAEEVEAFAESGHADAELAALSDARFFGAVARDARRGVYGVSQYWRAVCRWQRGGVQHLSSES